MLSPLPRRSDWAYSSLCFTQPYQPSPKGLSGRPAHCPFRGLLSVHSRYGLHTRAVTNSRHANRWLQPLRCLHDCSDCFRLERLPGGVRTHWKAPPLHGGHPQRTQIRDELKWLNSHLGAVRDLDVAIERLKTDNKQQPPAYRSWNENRADNHRHLARALRSARY